MLRQLHFKGSCSLLTPHVVITFVLMLEDLLSRILPGLFMTYTLHYFALQKHFLNS